MPAAEIAVLRFGNRRMPRELRSLDAHDIDGPAAVEAALRGATRVAVLGADADLALVLTQMLRVDRLDIEVAHLRGRLDARRALSAPARRVPLVRDDSGTALVGSALWLPPADSDAIHGEAVVDDTVLFDGDVAAVRIEPTTSLPGLRAAVLRGPRRRWVSGRAAQLGATGARVVRDGVTGDREVKRSTFYRHTTGWLRVG